MHSFMHVAVLDLVKRLVKVCRLIGVLAGFVLTFGNLAVAATAEQLFEQAQKAERDGQIVRAYVLYAEAAAADPDNFSYWQHAQALRPMASLLDTDGKKLPHTADQVDPTLFQKISDADLAQARQPLPPADLKAARGRRDYDITGDSKALWEQVAAALNLKVAFDTQYQPTRSFRFELNDADYRETLEALEDATNSFLSPISDRLIFIANDSAQKRTEFERTAAMVIPFSEGESVQELQEIATSVRGVLDARRLIVDNSRHLILVRDSVTKVRLAQMLFEDLLRPRAQVAVDVEILTTDVSSSLTYGLTLPTSFPLVSFVSKFNLLQSIPSGFTAFMGIGGGATLLGFGVTSAELFATVAKANSSTVLKAEIVAEDGQPATLHVGEKYPIVTNEYIGNTSGGTVFTPPPTINFEDLGLVLKITPRIHGMDEVSLDIDAEFKVLGATTGNGIPVIGSTKYESKVSVMTGEWAVLAGLMTASEARTITGIPIISYIPLFKNNMITHDNGETVIVLKPHILSLPPTESRTWKAWTGSETRLPAEL
jgi:general secretion pathway protein D